MDISYFISQGECRGDEIGDSVMLSPSRSRLFFVCCVNYQLINSDIKRRCQSAENISTRHQVLILNPRDGDSGNVGIFCQFTYGLATPLTPVTQDNFQIFFVSHEYLPKVKVTSTTMLTYSETFYNPIRNTLT